MNRITSITRRDIFDVVQNTCIDNSCFCLNNDYFCWHGVLSTIDFLERLYDLDSIKPIDTHYKSAKDEIMYHTECGINDYSPNWIFIDERFPIAKGSDEQLLRFLCEMIHPEVRNEKQNDFGNKLWNTVWTEINRLLSYDGYSITFDGNISGRIVFSWIDNRKQVLKGVEQSELLPFINLFNRGGYVLDFSTRTFDEFTRSVVGIGLCAVYNSSKGKSLTQFLHEAKEEDVIKLLSALLDYYDSNHIYDLEKIKGQYSGHFAQCKKIIAKWGQSVSAVENYAKELIVKFSSAYISSQIELMVSMQKDNPTEAIGKAKELVESCCKTILEERNVTIDSNWKLNNLVDETIKLLHITPKDIPNDIPEAESIKAILGSLKGIVSNIAKLRNAYGSGHGKSASYKGLEERHAKLAIGSCETLVDFLWASHERTRIDHLPQNK